MTFRKEYILTYGRVMQPFGRGEQNRKIKLSFSSGISVEVSLLLSCYHGPDPVANQAVAETIVFTFNSNQLGNQRIGAGPTNGITVEFEILSL